MAARFFLQREMSFRKTRVLLTGLAFLLATVGAIAVGLWGIACGGGVDARVVAFVAAPLLCLGGGGIWLILLYVRRRKRVLLITDEGIRYGTKSWGWATVSRLFLRGNLSGGYLVIQTKGWLSHDIALVVDQPLTSSEYDELVQVLTETLKKVFPDVEIP